MNIIVDILHPAHVHFFKNFIWKLQKKGHKIIVTTRNKDITLELLQEYNIPYTQISTVRKGFIGRFLELFQRNYQFYKMCRKFKPDFLISEQGPTTAPMGKLLGIPNVIFWDTEVSTLTNIVCYPLANAVYTPTSYQGKVRGNHLTYNGYQKLAYLHPRWFTPKKEILQKYNLPKNYTIVRVVSWTANHDKQDHGFRNLAAVVNKLKEHSTVFISSEEPLPSELQPYALKIAYKDIYDVLAYASLYLGESATMANEAAILGTPSIYLSTSPRGYIDELQNKYGVVVWATNEDDAIKHALSILQDPTSKQQQQAKVKTMLQDMDDVTQLMIDLVEKKTYVKEKG